MGLDSDGVDVMRSGRVAFCFPGQGSLTDTYLSTMLLICFTG